MTKTQKQAIQDVLEGAKESMAKAANMLSNTCYSSERIRRCGCIWDDIREILDELEEEETL